MSERPDLDQFIKGLGQNLFPEQARLGLSMGIDLEAQLVAIRTLLGRHAQAHEESVQQVDNLLKEARQNANTLEYPDTDERWLGRMHDGAFMSAAHSMAAVAMLAPFLEMLFKKIFEHVQAELGSTWRPDSTDCRSQAKDDVFWDPSQFVTANNKMAGGMTKGIEQLANSVSLTAWLPGDYAKALDALFRYRNAMFHNGFEWPDEELSRPGFLTGGEQEAARDGVKCCYHNNFKPHTEAASCRHIVRQPSWSFLGSVVAVWSPALMAERSRPTPGHCCCGRLRSAPACAGARRSASRTTGIRA